MTGTGPGTISIAWDAPSSDGGSPVTAYIVETQSTAGISYNKAAELDGSTLTCELTELVNGGEYYIRVRAQNMAGLSKGWAELDKPIAARSPASEYKFTFLAFRMLDV